MANVQTFGNLNYSKALALLSVPAEEREEFVQETDVAGRTPRELQAAIKERDEARRIAEEAKAEQRLAEEARAKMEQDMAHANERVAGLRQELEELRSKPVDVAVEGADPEVIAKAREEGIQQAEERLKSELEKAQAEAQEAKDALAKAKADEKNKLAKAEAKVKDAEDAKQRAIQGQEQAQAELEKVRKELAVSGNKAVVAFGEHFEAVQGHLGKLLSCLEELEQAGDRENHDKLSRAYQVLMEQYGKGD